MKMTADKARIGILREISDWLKLLGLIVLASEGILVIAYNSTEQTDPARKYFFPLMICLFASIVIGVFVDRFATRSVTKSHLYNDGQQYSLSTRWYFKSGITEEQLYFAVQANRVVGTRTTIHPKKGPTEYDVTGWHYGSTFWLEYHLPKGNGGGVLLLDEFTNDKFSGMVLSKDCDTGVKQCRTNMWFPTKSIKSHKQSYFMFVGALTPLQDDGSRLNRRNSLSRHPPRPRTVSTPHYELLCMTMSSHALNGSGTTPNIGIPSKRI